jgi:hypothetical protein
MRLRIGPLKWLSPASISIVSGLNQVSYELIPCCA